MFKPLLVAMLLALASLDVMAQGKTPNPEYERWRAFKGGSWVRLMQTTEADGGRSQVLLTHTLVELTPQKAVVETKTQVISGGEKTDLEPLRTEHAAVIDDPEGPVVDPEGITLPKPRVGTEDLTIEGKNYRCRTEQYTLRIDRDVIENKLWLAAEVPGGVVKSISAVKGAMPSVTTMVMVSCEAKR